MKPLRQGDVLFRRVDSIPKDAPKQKRIGGRLILVEGEQTGHAHAVLDKGAELYGDDLRVKFLSVLAEGGVAVVHEDHDTLMLAPGDYEVIRQVEYEPEGLRSVAD